MLEQILATMHIDPELLAELDDEQKQVLFFKMREEQVRRWKKWEAELTEEQKKSPFIATKPRRAGNLKVAFSTEPNGQPAVIVMDDTLNAPLTNSNGKSVAKETPRLKEDSAGKVNSAAVAAETEHQSSSIDLTALNLSATTASSETTTHSESKQETVVQATEQTKPAAHREHESSSVATSTSKSSTTASGPAAPAPTTATATNTTTVTLTKEAITRALKAGDEEILDGCFDDEMETAWKNSIRKSKEHDEMRRSVARLIRESLSDSSQKTNGDQVNISSLQKPPVPEKPNNITQLQTTTNKDGYPKGTKPKSRDDVIKWFQNVEQKRSAGVDRSTNTVATWFHGPISRGDAEKYLQGQRVGSFLVRVSEHVWGYVVSYLGTRFDGINRQDVTTIKHFLVDAGPNGYRFFGVDKMTHPSLADLITYHKKNPISIAGNETLMYPVGQTGDVPDYVDLFVGTGITVVDESSHL